MEPGGADRGKKLSAAETSTPPDPSPEPPWPFVVGAGRSGTSLLRSFLDSHPELAVPGESHFLPRFIRKRADWEHAGGFDTDQFLDALSAEDRYQRWGLDRSSVEEQFRRSPPKNLADALRGTYRAYAHAQGKPRYGDKTPGYVRALPLLADVLPEARIVHIVRDGRDVAASQMSMAWGPNDAARAASAWSRVVSAGRHFAARQPDRYLEVHYERLVADPEPELRRICSFIELTFTPVMLDRSESVRRYLGMVKPPGSHARLEKGLSAELRDWRRELSPDDAGVFQLLAGKELSLLDYPAYERSPSMRARLRALAAQARRSPMGSRISRVLPGR